MLEERDAEIAALRDCGQILLAAIKPLLREVDALTLSAYPAHGSGVVSILSGGNVDRIKEAAEHLRRAAAAYPTHSEGGEAYSTAVEQRTTGEHIAQPLSDQRSAAALLSTLKSAIAKRHRDNHDTSPPCAAEPDLELSDVKVALETLGASRADESGPPINLDIHECNRIGARPELSETMRLGIMAARLLLQNSIACAEQHHGSDFSKESLPGWLADSRRNIDNLEAVLASPSPSALTEEGG